MNAVEIEEAVSKLSELPFDADTFPFAFLEAFSNKLTTMNFAEFLHQKQLTIPQAIPSGTLTGLRGITKRSGTAPSDRELRSEYTDYLTQKYQ